MKRLVAFVFAVICLAACQKAPFLTISSPKSLTFTETGGTQSISFTCNRDWRITTMESWIRFSPPSGSASDGEIVVSIICDANTTYSDRNCTISLSSDELLETISVSQSENKGIVLSSENNISVEANGGDFTIDYQTNDLISVQIEENAKSWIEVVAGPSTKSLHNESVKFKVHPTNSYEIRSAIIQLVTTENKKESISLNQKGKDPINLSASETANCYIVPLTEDKYSFNATVRGNSDIAITEGTSASVIWQYENRDSGTQTIVNNLSYDKEKGVISFYPSGKSGNALVALKDKTGAILWSWHLWCFNFDEENGFHTINGYRLMDRNLGAVDVMDAGFAYQWGRKDPFPLFYKDARIDNAYCSPETGSVEYAAAHPQTIIRDGAASYGPTGGGGHWLSTENYTVLWRTAKTSNDPCPPGWKVISNGYLVMKDIPTGVFSKDDKGFEYFDEPYCVPRMLLPRMTAFIESESRYSDDSSFCVWTARTYWTGELGELFEISDRFWMYPYSAMGVAAVSGHNVRCQRVE